MELHPATLWESIADAIPERTALVQGVVRRSWRDLDDRAARLAGTLLAQGVEAGDRVGLMLHNCPEFVEAYFAALKIRAVPFNVNYRYTAPEVGYLLADADAAALVFHASLGDVVAGALASSGRAPRLVAVDDADGPDGAGADALDFQAAAITGPVAPRVERSPDDVTMIYTGGTTGMPKGVVMRVGPPLEYLLRTVPPLLGEAPVPVDEVPALARRLADGGRPMVSLPAPPLIHNTGVAVGTVPALSTGGSVVFLPSRHFDAVELWDTVVAEQVTDITIVGDAFARPMLAALRDGPHRDLGGVRSIASSGAMFSAEVKTGLFGFMPQLLILDIIGASEATMGMSVATAATPVDTARFLPAPGVIVVDDDGRRLEPGSGEVGLVAVPGGAEGYYNDDAKTAATFRVIGGVRYTIPGDHATLEADGTLVFMGRGSSCINTAGEKVFPEEVEEVLKAHPAVEDALVFGVPDARFGERVAAVVSASGAEPLDVSAVLHAARESLAGYKIPRAVVVVDLVPRTDVGKPDYAAAREQFAAGTPIAP